MSRIVGKECQEKFKIVSEKMEDVLKRFCSCHPPAATTPTATAETTVTTKTTTATTAATTTTTAATV